MEGEGWEWWVGQMTVGKCQMDTTPIVPATSGVSSSTPSHAGNMKSSCLVVVSYHL